MALESSFMLSMIARVWKAFASSVASAMCAGVVYDDRPAERVKVSAVCDEARMFRRTNE